MGVDMSTRRTVRGFPIRHCQGSAARLPHSGGNLCSELVRVTTRLPWVIRRGRWPGRGDLPPIDRVLRDHCDLPAPLPPDEVMRADVAQEL